MPTGNPQRGFEDFGAFNLWAPTVVDRMRGSKWNRALPGQKGGLPNVSRPGQPAPAEPESSRVIMFRREESFCRNRSRGIPPWAYWPQRVLTKLLSPMVMA